MEKNIELYEHNEKAYEALEKGLKEYPLAFIEHATGTGKSFIVLKHLYKNMRNKKILFITSHKNMLDQLLFEQMPTIGLTKKDFKCFDTLLYNSITKFDPKELVQKYDCIVFDEAHHCGAEQWSKHISAIKEEVLKHQKQMIGLSATKIRYLDNYMDVDEVFFDNHVVSRLSVAEAILRGLLPAPLYVNSLLPCILYVQKLLHKIDKISTTPEVLDIKIQLEKIYEEIKELSSINSTLKKYDVKNGEKYIVFCKNHKDLIRRKKEAEAWLKDIGDVETYEAHSFQSDNTNKENIASFTKDSPNKVKLMFSINIFNEGLHIKNVNGIFMFRKTASPIVYLQQIGRALALSLLHNQIKIFDFVDNISENQVIKELYKDIIIEAKRLISENPEKREFYEEILKRFKIIDHTTTTMEKLEELSKKIENNDRTSSKINAAIEKLSLLHQQFPDLDIDAAVSSRSLDYDYISAYNQILIKDEFLTITQIEKINEIGLHFYNKIVLDLVTRRSLYNGHRNINEQKNAMYKDCFIAYDGFYKQYNRRPDPENNVQEAELAKKYYNLLTKLDKTKLRRYLSSCSFKLTVEETILIGSYPIKEEMYEFFANAYYKVSNKKDLNNLEIRALRKLSLAIPSQYKELRDYLLRTNNIVLRLEDAIEYLENKDASDEFHLNRETAISTIHKNAKYITNKQFLRILELDIPLPDEINMTYEERLLNLRGYDSFYEKDKNYRLKKIDEYFLFIASNSRRPDPKDERERGLHEEYREYLFSTNSNKVKEICQNICALNIPLSLEEQILLGQTIEDEEIENYINEVFNRLNNKIRIDKYTYRILSTLVNKYDFETYRCINSLLEIERKYRKTEGLIANYCQSKSKTAYLRLTNYVNDNRQYLTAANLASLEEIGITLPAELTTEIKSLEHYSSLREKSVREKYDTLSKYYQYIRTFLNRPNINSLLDKQYRAILFQCTSLEFKQIINHIISLGVPLYIEEKIILGIASEKEQKKYFNDLEQKKITPNILTKRALRSLRSFIREESSEEYTKNTYESVDDYSEQIIRTIEKSITANPYEEIDFEQYSLIVPREILDKLDIRRHNYIIHRFLKKVISLLCLKKLSIKDVLSEEEYQLYRAYTTYYDLDNTSRKLLKEINDLDTSNNCLALDIKKSNLLREYRDYIINNSFKPSIESAEESESSLASRFEQIQEYLTKAEQNEINNLINFTDNNCEKKIIFDTLYDFILEKGRMPCGNSTDPEEVRLNHLYLKQNKYFSKEQANKIRELKRKYTQATLQSTLNFGKIQQ